MTIEDTNAAQFKHFQITKLSRAAFIDLFRDIYEHSPWVAERCFDQGIKDTAQKIDIFAEQMAAIMGAASEQEQLALIKAHPDLAGRAAQVGELTASSTKEQAGAGLDQCNKDEFQKFTRLNAAYKEKFGFPFIIAVTGLNRHIILEAFEKRLLNSPADEFQTALAQINKIAKIRLHALNDEA